MLGKRVFWIFSSFFENKRKITFLATRSIW